MSNVYEERTNEELSGWNDIVDIEFGFSFIGLKSDGSVLTTDYEKDWKIEDWHDIIQISAAPNTTVGLSRINTVLVVHDLYFGQWEEASWENVVCKTSEINSFDGYINHRIYIKDHKNMKGEYHTEIHAYDKNYNLLDRTPIFTTTIK